MSAVVIAGASGFMGRHLVGAFAADGTTVRTIGRRDGDARWGEDLRRTLDGADALINLAGRSVSCRYSKRNADAIFASRTETTRELGSGFSVAVARAWEHELDAAPAPVRKVALRTSIVLGTGGGALNPLVNLARLGFGGTQGDGGQVFSWIHVDDVYGAIRHVMADGAIEGPVNLATPHPVTNADLMAAVRAHLGLRVGLPLPAWALEAGAGIIRTEAELVLKSRWVHPGVLLDTGYAVRYPTIDEALADIARRTRRGLLPVQLG